MAGSQEELAKKDSSEQPHGSRDCAEPLQEKTKEQQNLHQWKFNRG